MSTTEAIKLKGRKQPVPVPVVDFDPGVKYGGGDVVVTVINKATGTHKVFVIEDVTRGPLAGNRVLKVRDGGDDIAFAFVTDAGKINVWKRMTDKPLGAVPNFFARAASLFSGIKEKIAAGQVVVTVEARCRACARALTDPVSVSRGIGPECFKKADLT